jgi:hypothetical protein
MQTGRWRRTVDGAMCARDTSVMGVQINWDRVGLTKREEQIIEALLLTHVQVASSIKLAKGRKADDSLVRESAMGAVEFMKAQFPDLNFRIET